MAVLVSMDVTGVVMWDVVQHVAPCAKEHAQERAKIYVLGAAQERAKLAVLDLVAMDALAVV